MPEPGLLDRGSARVDVLTGGPAAESPAGPEPSDARIRPVGGEDENLRGTS